MALGVNRRGVIRRGVNRRLINGRLIIGMLINGMLISKRLISGMLINGSCHNTCVVTISVLIVWLILLSWSSGEEVMSGVLYADCFVSMNKINVRILV